MNESKPLPSPSPQTAVERVLSAIERFLHVEAVSGIVLLIAAASALIWANSPAADSYEKFRHFTVSFGPAGHVLSESLHFLINDGLMTIFFLVVGMEIRCEIHQGSLATWKLASLPLAAALGGVAVPALIYLGVTRGTDLGHGWAVPTATDIAFAVGVLALLGRSIPRPVRALLLALAIIDDIVAVIVIALFYSSGLDVSGVFIAVAGIALVLVMQKNGIGSALAYIVPGVIVWFGFLKTGIHPTLAGVALGLLTPIALRTRAGPLNAAARVQTALHPWVAYGVMPLFALANAGVALEGANLEGAQTHILVLGVFLALWLGKPVGIVLCSWLSVRSGWSQLSPGLTWSGVWVIGCLGGIGFTMSIFIANLAFPSADALAAAKIGVLMASGAAGVTGMIAGGVYVARSRARAYSGE